MSKKEEIEKLLKEKRKELENCNDNLDSTFEKVKKLSPIIIGAIILMDFFPITLPFILAAAVVASLVNYKKSDLKDTKNADAEIRRSIRKLEKELEEETLKEKISNLSGKEKKILQAVIENPDLNDVINKVLKSYENNNCEKALKEIIYSDAEKNKEEILTDKGTKKNN